MNNTTEFHIHYHGTQGGAADEYYETLNSMACSFRNIVEVFPLLSVEAYIEFSSREYGHYTILVGHHEPQQREFPGLKDKGE